MYMKTLNESIERIKGMMKMIQEEDFSTPTQQPTEPSGENNDEIKSIVMGVLQDFANDPYFYDSSVDTSDGFFVIMNDAGNYTLEYNFDVNITSYGSYDPGDYYTPPYHEGPEYDFENMTLTVNEISDSGEERVIYKGKDISDFMNVTFPPRKEGERERSGADIMYREFGDELDEKISDMDDGPDEDYYRDR